MSYFIVESLGRTATQWIASAFSAHGDCCVAHGPTAYAYKGNKLSAEELKKENISIHEGMNSFYDDFDIDRYFQELKMSSPESKVFGNIHGFKAIKSADSKVGCIKVASITRHPVNRIESLVARNLYEMGFNKKSAGALYESFNVESKGEIFNSILSKYNVDFSLPENYLFFLNAIKLIQHDKSDYVIDNGVVFQFERLTSDIEYFIYFFNYVCNGDASFNNYLMSFFYDSEVVDKRTIGSSYEKVSKWEPWKKHLLKEVVKRKNLDKFYSEMGYDLSFLG